MKNCPYRHDEAVKKACLMKKDVKLNKRKRDEEEKIKGNGDKKDSKEVVMKGNKNKKGKKS